MAWLLYLRLPSFLCLMAAAKQGACLASPGTARGRSYCCTKSLVGRRRSDSLWQLPPSRHSQHSSRALCVVAELPTVPLPRVMLSPGVAVGRALWLVVVVINWCRFQTANAVEAWADAVLGTWEESLKSVLRESFAISTRVVNGFFAWLLALFPKQDRDVESSERAKAWQSWWRENRQSTFNAIIARDRRPSTSQSDPRSRRGTLPAYS